MVTQHSTYPSTGAAVIPLSPSVPENDSTLRSTQGTTLHTTRTDRRGTYSIGLSSVRRDRGLKRSPAAETRTGIDETISSAFLDKTYFPPCTFLSIAILAILSIGATAAAPLCLFLFADDIVIWAKIVFAAISGMFILTALPTWMVLLFWRRPEVQTTHFVPPPVDIVLTTYKEHIDEVAGSLAACVNIDYTGQLNIYVLDDAGRSDVAALCEEIGTKQNRKYPVHHVVRSTNKGRKGGNLNNWLETIPQTADFFITLDCDMRPFPNMCNVLFSHYYSLDLATQRKTAFLQSPQFFRNYRPANDGFDVCLMHFVKTVLPSLDALSTVPYIGTSALWKREALVRAGGFIDSHATEDVVTGCEVHRTKNIDGEPYISKYVPVPVSAGLSPRSLPELIDQRVRWNVGLVQMTAYHKFFLFAKGLGPMQRIAYLATCGGWIGSLLLYLTVLGGTLFTNGFLTWSAIVKPEVNISGAWGVAFAASFLVPFLVWLCLPGTTILSRIRGIQMATVFMTTQLVGLFYCLGVPVSVTTAAEGQGERRWHSHFWIHGFSYFAVVGSGIAALVAQWQGNVRELAAYLQVLFLIASWTWSLWPILKSLRSFQSEEQPMWLELESGRSTLFDRPVFSSLDTTAIGQMKELMVTLVDRIDEQEKASSRNSSLLQTDASGTISSYVAPNSTGTAGSTGSDIELREDFGSQSGSNQSSGI